MSNELIAAIEDDPDDPENYRVYGDWLEAQGHPRGELIAMYFLRERLTDHYKLLYLNNKIGKYVTAHQATFLGDLEQRFHPETATSGNVTWRFGFIRSATIMESENLRRLLEHPSGRFVRDLYLRLFDVPQPLVDTLAGIAPKTVRDLRIESWKKCDLSALWRALPKLEHLLAIGSDQHFGELDLPHLRSANLPAQAIDAIARGQLTKLEDLCLRYDESQRLSDLVTALERTDLPLRKLQLQNAPFANELVERLSSLPACRALREVNLDGSDLTNAGAKVWVENRPPHRLKEIRAVRSRLNKHGAKLLEEIADRVIYKVADEQQ